MSSLGFLNRFGRSVDLRRFDDALRACGVHPAQVPEGVKLAAVRLVRRFDPSPSDSAYTQAGDLIATCARSVEGLANQIGSVRAAAQYDRIASAIDHPESLDAALILLALHAGLAHPEIVDRYALAVEPGGEDG